MFGDEKYLKDTSQNSLKDTRNMPSTNNSGDFLIGSSSISYSKTRKLITALYMVTDMMDTAEPLRNKLRALGVDILSDISSPNLLSSGLMRSQDGASTGAGRPGLIRNIQSVLSFLDIAFTMNMISEMNKNILANEFNNLKSSLVLPQDNPVWLEEFLKEEKPEEEILEDRNKGSLLGNRVSMLGNRDSKGQMRLGVQKGSTLLGALRKAESGRMSDRVSNGSANFDVLKKERREKILNIIKGMGGSATIKDIKSKTEVDGSLSLGEKTLQRELVSMIKDGVLEKSGEKRWSRYSLKS